MARVQRYPDGSRVPPWDRAVDLTKEPAPVPEPAVTPVPEDLRRTIEAYMSKYPDRRSAVIPSIAAAQRHYGWCSPEALDQVAAVMRLTPAYVESIATFYDMFETEPKPAHDVYVCTNISCSLLGADELFEHFIETLGDEGDFNIRAFECMGACDIGPMASVDGVYVGPLELDDVAAIANDVRDGRPVLSRKQLAHRAAADPGAATPVPDPDTMAAGPPMPPERGRGEATSPEDEP
jgi:NADH:ubiquinone oxidoreductase subunit E